MNLVSVHLPKTAGCTFRLGLKAHFGDNYFDCIQAGDRERILSQLTNDCCVHGHIKPMNYKDVQDAVFITWMRHPVTRLLSHYYFWKSFRFRKKLWLLHKRGPTFFKSLLENWSFERFALGPEVQNYYTMFLEDFSLDQFSFIGITEHYDEDYKFFCNKYLGEFIPIKPQNINRKPRYDIPEDLRRRIEEHHSADMDLYNQALEIRVRRRVV